jgi:hypothetical protein
MKLTTVEELRNHCCTACHEDDVIVKIKAGNKDDISNPCMQQFEFTIAGSEELECLRDMLEVMKTYGYNDFRFIV